MKSTWSGLPFFVAAIFLRADRPRFTDFTAFITVLFLAWGSSHCPAADARPAGAVSPAPDYFNPVVTYPVRGGFNLGVPKELGNRQLAEMGLVDVTATPFRADQTGRKDATRAIQAAVNFARDHQMVCFFPAGTYRVSDTIECIQNPSRQGGGMFWPCVLQGSRRGVRPKIVLTARSPGFDDPAQRKRVISIWARGAGREAPVTAEQANILFNSMFLNLDITVEEGNSGAVALRMEGAQGSGAQDCVIDVTHGHTGLEGGCGSGGSHAGITVIGGRIGMDLTQSRPAPTLTGITLINQTATALVYRGIEALCVVGLKLTSQASGPVIVGKTNERNPLCGQISVVDSQIDLQAPGGIAVSSASALYLKNVYVRGAAQIVSSPDGARLAGDPAKWTQVVEYAHGPVLPEFKGYRFAAPVYLDGQRQEADVIVTEPAASPPDDLQARHLWGEGFHSYESRGAVSVKAPPFGAKGDSFADDTDAIQRAVDENDIVYLPKGYYRITRTIQLRPTTKLVGIAQSFSVLMTREAEGSFADAASPQPLVRTADDRDARTILAFCYFLVPREMAGAFGLHWRCGPQSVLRSAGSILRPLRSQGEAATKVPGRHPLTLVSGHGAGRWYNLNNHELISDAGFRYLLLDGAAGPLAIYQCNIEHVLDQDAQIEISRSQRVAIYGMKSEGNSPALRATDSSEISIFSYGGNLCPKPGSSLFVFERSTGVLLANVIPRLTLPHSGINDFYKKDIGIGTPDTWAVVIDTPTGSERTRTRPLDHPVLYRHTAGGPKKAKGNLE
ncbi:MAG: glycosyl hydrolase family 28-related protein [Opitutaceae bacterium]|nr:glycosyl hydrolase family 28-related protein [Opitutaceae bacterium]